MDTQNREVRENYSQNFGAKSYKFSALKSKEICFIQNLKPK